jgi:FkbM family methyltransferase
MKIFSQFKKLLNHPNNKQKPIYTAFLLLWWKVNQLFFKIPAIIEIAPNRKCICKPESSFGSLIVYTNRPEYLEMKLTELLLNTDSTFLDVGSGIGDFSLIASSKITTGKIFAFEPSQEPLSTLKENIAINFLEKKIKIIEEVASNKVGTIKFNEESVSEVSHIGTGENGIIKKTTTLDKVIESNKLTTIDLIKIDVEGAESLVIEGLEKSFESKLIKVLIIELNSNANQFNSSKVKLVKKLINHNFKVYVIGDETLTKFKPNNVDENETINVLAVHKSFDKKSLLNQFLS